MSLKSLVRQAQNTTKIITITSGKGGVGKTNLAVNLAIAFAQLGEKTLIFDADLGLSNANIVLGVVPSPKYNLLHVIKGEKRLDEIIEEGPEGVRLISGVGGITTVADITGLRKKRLIEEIERISQLTDILLIDTSAGLSHQIISFVLIADEVILITTPEPTAIADAYSIIKAIVSKNRDVNIKLVINRVKNIVEGKRTAERLIEICSNFLGIKIENLGYILEDEVVHKSVMQQRPFLLTYPKSKAASCIYHIRDRLAQIEETPKGFGYFIRRFFFKEDEI